MKNLFNTVLRVGLAASLSDREAFVQKVADTIEKYNNDPEKAERLSKILAAYLEDVKDNLTMRNVMKNSMKDQGVADKEDMEALKQAINELTREVKDLKKKSNDV